MEWPANPVQLPDCQLNWEALKKLLTPPSVRAMGAAASPIGLVTGVTTAIPMDTLVYSQGSGTATMWTIGSPTRLVASVAGVYDIAANLCFQIAAGGIREILLKHNGATFIGAQDVHTPSGANFANLSVASQYKLKAGEYVELYGFQSSGAGLAVLGGAAGATCTTNISMCWVGPY